MRSRLLPGAALFAVLASLSSGVFAQDEKKKGSDAPPKKTFTLPKAGELKKYDDVITKDAVTKSGVFAVHKIDEKVYFELPQALMGQLMLWQGEVAKGPSGVSWGGMSLGTAVLKWERRGNKVYLWKVGFSKRGSGGGIEKSVESGSMDSIIATFNVECEGKDRSAVISVANMFLSGLSDMPITRAVGSGGSVDESRSYISDIKAFPQNIEIRSLLTVRGGGGGGLFGGAASGGGSGGSKSYTALVHHSLVMLPEVPMQGRFADPRVGYFTESFENYSDPKTWTVTKAFITRYRLEKKNPSEAVSEVVKPITFYLGKEVPEKWKPYLKKGVEDWAPAFEKAGFKNAIVCKDAPTPAEDPNWDAEDSRHSVIRWVAEPVANAMGPHVHDPRSGEILSSHVIFWHDVSKLEQLWYFVQCSGLDDKARKLPFADDLAGELMRNVCTHEVGHSLGLRHNHRGSQAYTVAQLRDPKFIEKYGHLASVMSYGRYNYVAQPEDGIKKLIPILGPYDYFAIEWGYKAIPEAKTAEAERKTLDEWAARQIKEPFLRFGGEDGASAVDPSVLTENIGSDAIEATALGLKNVSRALDYILPATTEKGEDFGLLEEVHKEVISHRRNWFNAVAKLVGGVQENRILGGRGGESFVRVPKEKQKEAVKFLLENAFTTPTQLLNPGVINQFKYTGVANDVMAQQKALLQSLLTASRLNRLFDAEVLGADKAYTVTELVADLQDGIFAELKAGEPKIEPLRRNLQRVFIDILRDEIDPPASSGSPVTLPGPRGPRGGGGASVSELR
ncbi:MAG TPA: zinc-dependent metalloprotease, partial [Gemmataceae bacterium]|nr:zinc-dependent metalloprotease [Gemmataceae bacterium]